MPFYQMLCIATHVNEYRHIKELVRQTATHVLKEGGVVREIKYLGALSLPQRMRRHKAVHSVGDYWTLHFDTAPRTLRSLNAIMRRDPRVIRWTVLKLAEKVEDVAEEGQKARQKAASPPSVVLTECC
ncbi:hypothetical protein C0993_000674 [Termitomyces sp. T159_Od127]|nr:hypothetical protein C0993_000674 [Termitomyces sp. T159_Od127]